MTERAQPFHCPYCGESDLWPQPEGAWECRSCLRAFTVKMVGMVRPTALRDANQDADQDRDGGRP